MQGIPTHTSHYRRRWEAEGYQTEHVGGGSSRCCGMGGRVRSHRSRRRPVRWRSGPTCAHVNGLFACKGVGGVGLGRSGRSAGGGVGGVPVLPPVGPSCAWRGVAVSGSVCQFRVLFLCVGALHPICRQCTSSVRVHRHVTGAPPRNGCSAPYRVQRPRACGGCRGCGGLLCLSCLPLGLSSGLGVSSAWAVFCWGLCGVSCCGSSEMSHVIPRHVFQTLKSHRWNSAVFSIPMKS